ncbi:hypothetical protein GQ600_14434 [Phytophthora cactorum]|nr:hypothetical protein GQ600_14434 [Phytophthora cactorum]
MSLNHFGSEWCQLQRVFCKCIVPAGNIYAAGRRYARDINIPVCAPIGLRRPTINIYYKQSAPSPYVLAITIVLFGVSNGITAALVIAETTTAESNLIHGAVRSYHAATRELSDQDSDEERRGGRGGGGRGGGGRGTTYYYGGGNPSLGLMNTNGVTRYKEKKCNRFTN